MCPVSKLRYGGIGHTMASKRDSLQMIVEEILAEVGTHYSQMSASSHLIELTYCDERHSSARLTRIIALSHGTGFRMFDGGDRFYVR